MRHNYRMSVGETVSGGGTNGPGSAHDHISDRPSGGAEILGSHDLKGMG